jgi:hypothetical protein
VSDKSNAAQYADSIAADIDAMDDANAPFGWINQETGEWANVEPDGWRDDEETPWVEAGPSDYIQNCLDIEYIVSSDRTYKAARILIAFGGPNAWINTQTSQLEVAWWSAPEYRRLPSAFVNGLDEFLEEMWGDN